MNADSSLKENYSPAEEDIDSTVLKTNSMFKFKKSKNKFFPSLSKEGDAATSENNRSSRFFDKLNVDTNKEAATEKELGHLVTMDVTVPRSSSSRFIQEKEIAMERLKKQRAKKKKKIELILSSDSDSDFELRPKVSTKIKNESHVTLMDISGDLFSGDSDLETYMQVSTSNKSDDQMPHAVDERKLESDKKTNVDNATFTVSKTNRYLNDSMDGDTSEMCSQSNKPSAVSIDIDNKTFSVNSNKCTEKSNSFDISISQGESSGDIEEDDLEQMFFSPLPLAVPNKTKLGNTKPLYSSDIRDTTSDNSSLNGSSQRESLPEVTESIQRKRNSKGSNTTRPLGLPKPKKPKLSCLGSRLLCTTNGIPSSSNSDSYLSETDIMISNDLQEVNNHSKSGQIQHKKSEKTSDDNNPMKCDGVKHRSSRKLSKSCDKTSHKSISPSSTFTSTSSVQLKRENNLLEENPISHFTRNSIANKKNIRDATYVVSAASLNTSSNTNPFVDYTSSNMNPFVDYTSSNTNPFVDYDLLSEAFTKSSNVILTEQSNSLKLRSKASVDGLLSKQSESVSQKRTKSGVDDQLEEEGMMNPQFRSALSVWSSSISSRPEESQHTNKDNKKKTRKSKKKSATASYSIPKASLSPTNSTITRKRHSKPSSDRVQDTTQHTNDNDPITISPDGYSYSNLRLRPENSSQSSNVITPARVAATTVSTLFPPLLQVNNRSGDHHSFGSDGSPSILLGAVGGTPSDSINLRHTSTPVDTSLVEDRTGHRSGSRKSLGSNRSGNISGRRLRNTPMEYIPDRLQSTGTMSVDMNIDDSVMILDDGDVMEGETPGNRGRSNRVSHTPGAAAAVRSVGQIESDEAMARRLQEEMDREFAEHVAKNSHTPISNQRVAPRNDNEENGRMLSRIGRLSDYEWQVHRCIYSGQDIPPPPTGQPQRELDAILDLEILAYMENHPSAIHPSQSGASVTTQHFSAGHGNRRSSNIRSSSSSARRRLSSEEENAMLSRIGSLSDHSWQVHRAAFRGDRNLLDQLLHTPDNAQNNSGLDAHVLEYLQHHSPAGTGLDAQIREYLQHHSPAGTNEHAPVLLAGSRHAARGARPRLPRRNSRRRRGNVAEEYMFESMLGPLYAMGERPAHGYTAVETNDYEELLALGERIGEVRQRGLSKTQIDMLPTKTFSSADHHNESDTPECNVCCCDYEQGEKLRILPCFHSFHATCIDKWIKTNATCPICRADVKLD